MAPNNKTLYEVLGVPRNAKITDIGLAYNRFKSEMQKESAAPDARRVATAKFAFDTLSDPARRAEYDESLEPAPVKRHPWLLLLGGAGILAAGVAGYVFLIRTPEKTAAPTNPSATQLLEMTSPFVGRVQGTVMSGEVKPAGVAIATAQGEMVTTCHGLPAGSQLSVILEGAPSKAEIGRANEELDVCTLKVKDVGSSFVKMRGGEPAAGEKIYAVLSEGSRPTQLREGRVARSIEDPKGSAIELKVPGVFPTGTPVIDAQGRLVGIITTPHAFGDNLTVALGTSRFAESRSNAPATKIASTPVSAATQAAAPAAAPTPSPAIAPAAPSLFPRRGFQGRKVDEGFTTDIEEDEHGHMLRPVDSIRKGVVGQGVTYWTKWENQDTSRTHEMRCVITFYEESQAIVDDTSAGYESTPEGFWYCGINAGHWGRFLEGTYRFIIYVDGEKIAENTIPIEKRFIDRLKISPWKLGLGLLACLVIGWNWLRKKREKAA